MRPVDHPSNTRVIGVEHGKTLEESGAIPISDLLEDGEPVTVSFWQPSPEDLKLIAQGNPVAVCIWGRVHPPLSVFVGSV